MQYLAIECPVVCIAPCLPGALFSLPYFRGDPNFSWYLDLGRVIFSKQHLLHLRTCVAYAAELKTHLLATPVTYLATPFRIDSEVLKCGRPPRYDDSRPNGRQHIDSKYSLMKALEVSQFSRKWRSISLS